MLTLIKGKGITVEDHERAIDVTRAAGIAVMGTFIVGTPIETYEEMPDRPQTALDGVWWTITRSARGK